MGRIAIALAAGALLLGATACGERSEPTGADAGLYPVTVQSGDNQPLVMKRPAQRIATLDQPTEDIVDALGAGSRVVLHAPTNRIDFAALKRSRPDLIVAGSDADEHDLSRAVALTNAPVYLAPGDSVRQVERAITQLALLTNTPVAGRRLVNGIEAKRHQVDAELRNTPDVTVFVDLGLFTTVSDQSLIGDLIREAHAKNVAGAAAEAGPVDAAQLQQLDPDVYMATSDTLLSLADLRRNPKTRHLRAVREGAFVAADAALLEPGPRVGEGLVEVARLLHPDAVR